MSKMPHKDPLQTLNTPNSETEALKRHVSSVGKTMDTLAKVATVTELQQEPDGPRLHDLWILTYSKAVESVYARGLAYYNQKPDLLKQELQLAVIRADEALEAFIAVRQVTPDPVSRVLARWGSKLNTNPLKS
jgi:hypothetical protein